ncbi:MAG: glycosyltransferase family 2 protein [Microthrixaceae bacterium]
MTTALVPDGLFTGMPGWDAVAFLAAFAVIAVNLIWNVWLFKRSRPFREAGPVGDLGEDHFTWVFLVPALNEEVTIADSVARLLDVQCTRRKVVVIDDGSTDATPEVLAGIGHRDLLVLRREAPLAQQGKAAALNDAWARLPELVDDLDAHRTIVCVVDADGRLAAGAPAQVANWFADGTVGGVQVRVRIYNRHRPLTWAQDVEFGVYGALYQAGRASMGTAGMGGNGQFNRLAALDDLARRRSEEPTTGSVGPWSDRLTEDQDLGLRLIEAGWRCGHDNRTQVDQQGLPGLRKLFRQRTRWAQGNLQAFSHIPGVTHAPISRRARLDLVLYLLQPVFGAIVGIGLFASILAAVLDGASFVPADLWVLVAFYFLGFGGVVLGCIARCGRGPKAWLWGWIISTVYAAYTWILWPVLVRATWRQLRAERTWAKTEREQIAPVDQLVS